MSSDLTFISVFAGCGGSSLGYKLAGFRELLAVEKDEDACETFRMNFEGIDLYCGDIKDLSVSACLERTGLGVGDLTVFDGSPPCQGFSSARGRLNAQDPRNALYKEYVRLLSGLMPKFFVFENVPGLVRRHMYGIYSAICSELSGCGYNIDSKILDASFFGVPQRRRRLFIIGVRTDICITPSLPLPCKRPITVREALRTLVFDPKEEQRLLPEFLLKYAVLHGDKWNVDYKRYIKYKGNLASAMSTKFCSWDRVCGTIMKSEIATSGVVHPDRQRYISLSEAKRLSSFPDDFKFTCRKKGIERIGNSVPPELMRSIAEHIKSLMGDRGLSR